MRQIALILLFLITSNISAQNSHVPNLLQFGHFTTLAQEKSYDTFLTGTIGKTIFSADGATTGAGAICITQFRFQVRPSGYSGGACIFSTKSICGPSATYGWYQMYSDSNGFNLKTILGENADFPFAYRIFTAALNSIYPSLPGSMCSTDPESPPVIGMFDLFTISIEGYTSSNTGASACDGTNQLKTFKSDDSNSSCTMNTFNYNGDRTAFLDSSNTNTIDMVGEDV